MRRKKYCRFVIVLERDILDIFVNYLVYVYPGDIRRVNKTFTLVYSSLLLIS